MKKRITALLLCALLILTALPTARAAFDDITDPEVSLAATNLRGLGIVAGTSATSFTPDKSLTRAEACALIINTMGLSNQVNTYKQRTVFSDVLPSSWYTGIVNLAYAQGVVNGYGNGTFGPEDKVTYGHFATMLLRLLGYSSEQIGSVWPLDYTAFCDNLELSEGLSLKPDQILTRAQAALLLYRTLNTKPNNGKEPYYTSLSSVASTRQVIVLDNNVSYGGTDGLLMVYGLEGASGLDYCEQTTAMEDTLLGSVVTLLLNDRGDVMAAVPESSETRDVVIGSAKASGITGSDGTVYRINSAAVTIVGDNSYTWGSNGYVQVNSRAGQTARLFYQDGAVTHVCLTAGTAGTSAQVAVAQTDAPAGDLARKLGVSGSYTITKNGIPAQASDLAKYDTAYFDKVSKTLCASDYQFTGYIQSVQPSMDAAQSITVSGCTLPVLEAAWSDLENYKLGDRVTLLLTDDCKVAAAVSSTQISRDIVGVLGADGRSVTLCGSGLVLSAGEVQAEEKLRGTLVKAYVYADKISCYAYSGEVDTGTLNLTNRTLGSYQLAPACTIYEYAGTNGYLYSLSGERGVASTDFEPIYWTKALSSSYISTARLNSAGQVDLIVLKDVTGNCYEYGALTRHTGNDGVVIGNKVVATERGQSTQNIYSNAVALTNGTSQSKKYLSSHVVGTFGNYFGIALGSYNASSQQVTKLVQLNRAKDIKTSEFLLEADDWHVVVGGSQIPVSSQVQIYFQSTDQWLSGTQAIHTALGNGTPLDVYYDRTPVTGAQARVIVVN